MTAQSKYSALIKETLAFREWPEGMTCAIFHGALATRWGMCRTEAERLQAMEEARAMFETVKNKP